MRTFESVADLAAAAGETIGQSDWVTITQEDVNLFADATGDHQWIHVDPERAAQGPFKGTIAHGFLTLSLVIPLFGELLTVQDVSMGINYGLNRVRFPAPVPVGSKIRLAATLGAVEDAGVSAVQAVVDYTIEVEGGGKPACVAQGVYRYYA